MGEGLPIYPEAECLSQVSRVRYRWLRAPATRFAEIVKWSISRPGGDVWPSRSLPRLIRQPGFSQALFVSRNVFWPPERPQSIPQIGNAQRGVELPQPC